MPVTTCIFDAYGTLFDVTAAARNAAENTGNARLTACWPEFAETWRIKQLSYSWLRQGVGEYASFWKVTQDALDYTLEAFAMGEEASLRHELLCAYKMLDAYSEVPAVLKKLKTAGLTVGILSNGSPDMLSSALDSAGLGDLVDPVISVDPIRQFKPGARTYGLIPQQLAVPRDNVLFVSSNCWDACCAAGQGFATAWVNRSGLPMDRLAWTPHHTVNDLNAIPDIAGV